MGLCVLVCVNGLLCACVRLRVHMCVNGFMCCCLSEQTDGTGLNGEKEKNMGSKVKGLALTLLLLLWFLRLWVLLLLFLNQLLLLMFLLRNLILLVLLLLVHANCACMREPIGF